MKTNRNHSQNNTEKTNKNIRNNSLFTDLTVEEEVFVRGGTQRFRAPELLFKPS